MLTAEDIRKFALALPEAEEAPHFESTSFRVRKKIFATLKPADWDGSFHVKLDPEDQHNLAAGHPGTIVPGDGYWGRKGWTRVHARSLSEADLAGLLRTAWLTVAPKTLIKQVSAGA
ncbi:MAG: MmcQ/YjbR family DNA-binding protein [Phenylobacterium sp.]|jgi:predicted DNA-binding protein (MmcQ/YjbR family)|uniref:MmcQ/YjbR family DNA-binding protein n=1 Tax=Phenylobacterium sp. TaxID=1871053 RepID=UPI00391C031D